MTPHSGRASTSACAVSSGSSANRNANQAAWAEAWSCPVRDGSGREAADEAVEAEAREFERARWRSAKGRAGEREKDEAEPACEVVRCGREGGKGEVEREGT